MDNIIAFILGGGRGSRIYPLTKERSKPAIPLGGKYRLIDIPISNCMNSKIYKIFVLTQFNSKSLNQHINNAYRFDHFSDKFVDILPASQTMVSTNWYQGTADAIRQNIRYIDSFPDCDTVLILSGDQLYNFDFRNLYDLHKKSNADLTLATIPIKKDLVGEFGIVRIKNEHHYHRIIDFVEKPKQENKITEFILNRCKCEQCLASMGIYMFKKEALIKYMTETTVEDFGKELIPQLIKELKVVAYLFDDYWEDLGTIKAFHRANLDLLGKHPKLKLKTESPIYTNPRFLQPIFCNKAKLENVIIGDGAIIFGGTITNSVLGVRSVIFPQVTLEKVVMLGADWYETEEERKKLLEKNNIPIGINEKSIIKNAIIDKNARIGKNVKLINKNNVQELVGSNEQYFIKDGIIVIPKGVTIPNGFEL